MRTKKENLYQNQPGIGTSATASIGSGDNGTVNITVDKEGAIGNNYEVEVVDPEENDNVLSASLSGWTITVELATDGSGVILEDGSNDATAVASAIDGITEFSATASGTGAGHIGVEEAKSFTDGEDEELISEIPEKETWIIDKIFATNVSGSTTFFSLSIVPEGGSVNYPNRFVEEKDISANNYEAIDGPIILEEGEKLAGLIETADAVSISIIGEKIGVNHYNS